MTYENYKDSRRTRSFLIALALGSQNQSVVVFNYLLAQGEFIYRPYWDGFIVGFACAAILFGGMHFKSQLRIRKLTKQLKLANQQSAPETKVHSG